MTTLTYTVGSNWGSGLVGNMVIAPTGTALSGWTAEFDAAFDITNIWGAEIVSHVGNHYVVRNASWNAYVPVGGSVNFGFQAVTSGGDSGATGFAVNGVSLGGTPEPVLPSLSVGDISFAEGSGGNKVVTFTVSLSAASTDTVTVDFTTADGTATAGSDYLATAGKLTFAAGEMTKTVSVIISGDTLVESDETFALHLSGATGAVIGTAQATATILNDDVPPPTVSVADVSITEGSSGVRQAVFTVTLSHAAAAAISVAYATADGTALAGSDYDAASGMLTFAAGETTKTIAIAVHGDTAVEADERFALLLSSANGAVIDRGAAAAIILNDDIAALPPGSATMTYSVGSNWGSGFIGNVAVKAGSDGLSGWTAEFDGHFDITNIWGAEIVSHVGDHYVVRNASWNGSLGSGASATFGFQASTTNGASDVSGFLVNGHPADGTPTPVVPGISVADISFEEGAAGTTEAVFTVTLSAAASEPVSVAFATADGTALAGSDYTAASGTLTFAAGETSKTIHVAVNGDTLVENNETFALDLSSPTNATITRGHATATIQNDDAPLPTISVADITAAEENGGGASGYFSTRGNQIIDQNGNPVKIAGVNWFGMESDIYTPHGLWARGYKEMMDDMVTAGFNTLRLPFSGDLLHTSSMPSGIDFNKNPDLQGLTGLQIMDKVVEYAGEIGLRVILDHHRNSAGAGPSDNGLWYDDQHPESEWISDWQMLASRYAGNTTVIGADLHNEPYAGTWGGGGANDWAAAAERAGNAIGEVNPDWLIFVEGVGNYQNNYYWWGGNLMGVRDRPIDLAVDNKVVYSAHDYPNSVYAQPWFQDENFAETLPAKFDEMWGYIYRENIAPVYIGEFGTQLIDPKDKIWLDVLVNYMSGDFDNNGTIDIPSGQEGINWTYWAWNPNSGDTFGIVRDDWKTVETTKLALLQPITEPLLTGDGTQHPGTAVFTVSLSAPATSAVTVGYSTVSGTATTADYIPQSGTITFAPGEQMKTIAIDLLADQLAEGNEQFGLLLHDASGATVSRAEATATILDNDVMTIATPYIDPNGGLLIA